jgi:DNA-binding transcriptional ArsR family regulator
MQPTPNALNLLTPDRAAALSEVLAVLGDATRLRLLSSLGAGEECVQRLEQRLALRQATVSHHLGILRRAGLVAARRRGKSVFYRLAEPAPGPETLRVTVGGMSVTLLLSAPLADAA